jgi:hypothetical protein
VRFDREITSRHAPFPPRTAQSEITACRDRGKTTAGGFESYRP